VYNAITDVEGIEVGHYTDLEAATGCTVVLCRDGAVAGVDVRGSAPGTRETDLLRPLSLVQQVHAVVLSGGSAYGLDVAGGVMRWLEEQHIGFDVGVGVVPIVPAAVLFDLAVSTGYKGSGV
jgi:L-aminopeptidase/D-esterase-like protein